jgi:hypothetical protein
MSQWSTIFKISGVTLFCRTAEIFPADFVYHLRAAFRDSQKALAIRGKSFVQI